MRLLRLLFLMLAVVVARPAMAQTIVISEAPKTVSVSLYRYPDRSVDEALNLEYLQGFALISETRELDLPPGEVTIRFEGVASGIQPETAIVTGADLREKNRDRMLLSQRGLLDAFTGQRVVIKRTNPQTGKVTEESGTIRSGGDRVVLQTAEGFEALYCNYVGELAPDAKSMSLMAWLTMASGDETSFVDANAYAIAGKLERQERDEYSEEDSEYGRDNIEVYFSCWPYGTTTSNLAPPTPPPAIAEMLAPAPVMMRMMDADEAAMDIVVTSSRKMAEQEDLGDLKLYRIPFPVTVAAQSQKQVAFLSKKAVKGELVYRSRISGEDYDDVQMLFRVQNKKEDGLGEPLPAGKIAFFQSATGRRMLVGESQLNDKAVGEEVEFSFASASNVSLEVEDKASGKNWERYALTVSNANPFPVTFEAEFPGDQYQRYDNFSGKTIRKKGKTIWRVTVAANSKQELGYRFVEIDNDG
jgi:hypothetical protein